MGYCSRALMSHCALKKIFEVQSVSRKDEEGEREHATDGRSEQIV
jgi:hypothetical protein